MREEDKVFHKLSVNDIQNLGFDWPKYALIEEYGVIKDGKVDFQNDGRNAVKPGLLQDTTESSLCLQDANWH